MEEVQTHEEEAAPPPPPPEETHATVLGLARWVYFGFAAAGLLAFFVIERLLTFGWDYVSEGEPQALMTVGIGAVGGVIAAFALYKNATVNRLAHEVVEELAKVTWPTKAEIRVATVVVIITSLIAAVIIGVFDGAWSWVTDLIYGAKQA